MEWTPPAAPDPPTPPTPKLSLLAFLDSGLAYIVQRVLLNFASTALPVTGMLGLFVTYASFFEHGRGVLELSRVEVVFFVLLFAMERRFNRYRRLFGYSGWHGLWRIFTALGVASLIVWVGSLARMNGKAFDDPTLLQPLWLLVFLLSIYLATPTRPAKTALPLSQVQAGPSVTLTDTDIKS